MLIGKPKTIIKQRRGQVEAISPIQSLFLATGDSIGINNLCCSKNAFSCSSQLEACGNKTTLRLDPSLHSESAFDAPSVSNESVESLSTFLPPFPLSVIKAVNDSGCHALSQNSLSPILMAQAEKRLNGLADAFKTKYNESGPVSNQVAPVLDLVERHDNKASDCDEDPKIFSFIDANHTAQHQSQVKNQNNFIESAAKLPKLEKDNAVILCNQALTTLQFDDLHELHSLASTLKVLRLAENLFTTLPLSVFAPLKSLKVLDLRGNKLQSFHANVGACCPLLEELWLDRNSLKVFPLSTEALKCLRLLSCSYNHLTAVPPQIDSIFGNLNALMLDHNEIRSLPLTLGNLKQLESLDISANAFTQIPVSLGNLPSLQSLSLDWFRYCSPSLPRSLRLSYDTRNFENFRNACQSQMESGAVYIDALHLIRLLSTRELHLSAVDRRGRSRLHVAACEGHFGVVASLSKGGAEVDALDADGLSPLVLSVREGRTSIVKYLIMSGASLHIGGGLLGSALHVATVNLDFDACSLLLSSGARVNQQDFDGNTSLHVLMSIFDKNLVKAKQVGNLLISQGADCNAINLDGWSPLHLAARRGQEAGISFVIQHNLLAPLSCQRGVCAHIKDARGRIRFIPDAHTCSPADHLDKLRSQSAVRQGPTKAHFHVKSPASIAVSEEPAMRSNCDNANKESRHFHKGGALSISRLSLHSLRQNKDEKASLHSSCSKMFDLNIRGGSHAWTALHLAGHASHAGVIMQIVAAGADVTIRNRSGRTAHQVARGNLVTSKVLRSAEDEWRTLKVQPKLRKYLRRRSQKSMSDVRSDHTFHVHSVSLSSEPLRSSSPLILNNRPVSPSESGQNKADLTDPSRLVIGAVPFSAVLNWQFAPTLKRARGDEDEVEVAFDDSSKLQEAWPKGLLKNELLVGDSKRYSSQGTVLSEEPTSFNFNEMNANLQSHCEAVELMRLRSTAVDTSSSRFRNLLEFKVTAPSVDDNFYQYTSSNTLKSRGLNDMSVLATLADKCLNAFSNDYKAEPFFVMPFLRSLDIRRLRLVSTTGNVAIRRISLALQSFFVLKRHSITKVNVDNNSLSRPLSAAKNGDPRLINGTWRLANRLEGLKIALEGGLGDLTRWIAVSFRGEACRLSQVRNSDRESLIHILCQRQVSTTEDLLKFKGTFRGFDSDADILLFLFQGKACTWDVNAGDSRGLTALHHATISGNLETTQLLLLNGANPNKAEVTTGWSALHFAVCQGRYAILQQLLHHPQIDSNVVDFFGWSPFAEAINRGDLRAMALLINRGIRTPIYSDSAFNLKNSVKSISNALISASQATSLEKKMVLETVLAYNGFLLWDSESARETFAKSKNVGDISRGCSDFLGVTFLERRNAELRELRKFIIPDSVVIPCTACFSTVSNASGKRSVCQSCGLPACPTCLISTPFSGALLEELQRNNLLYTESTTKSIVPQGGASNQRRSKSHSLDNAVVRRFSARQAIGDDIPDSDEDLKDTATQIVALNRKNMQRKSANSEIREHYSDLEVFELLGRSDLSETGLGTDWKDWPQHVGGNLALYPRIDRTAMNSKTSVTVVPRVSRNNIRIMKMCMYCFAYYASLPSC